MPQSGTGKTVTTTEPKFVPAEGISLDVPGINVKIRLVDCVGYMIPGAVGHLEDGEERMVATPWCAEKMPFAKAAELGTEKVIKDHSTVGIVITTDGTIGTMDREEYREAESRVIKQLQQLGKPFITIVNSTNPEGVAAKNTAAEMEKQYGMPVIIMDCAKALVDEFVDMINKILGRFPVKEVLFDIPGYVQGLGEDHWLRRTLVENIKSWAEKFKTMDDMKDVVSDLADGSLVSSAEIRNIDMGTGQVDVRMEMADDLYYKIITELMGEDIDNDYQFSGLLREFVQGKRAYDRLRNAMEQVEECGYGIVQPAMSEMTLDEPEVFKQGNKYGVRITAKAPTLHIIKTDISTEVAPLVGSENQSQDLVVSLKKDMEQSDGSIWKTNIFGKSLYEMVSDQMESKISSVPDNIRGKMQKSLQKISDEGKEYFICIVI